MTPGELTPSDTVEVTEPSESDSGREACLVLCPDFRTGQAPQRDAQARLAEAVGLALAIDLDVVESRVLKGSRPKPGTLIGQGVLEEMARLIDERAIMLCVVDHALTPIQQRNLERAWSCKVIDRTGLILEIFGERARTREGQLQVELAALSYQRSRLVRSWTHLERQRGGFGFLGGPGESQLEIDRRLILERIARIKQDLEKVRRTRDLHRKARQRVPYPVVALVGYTNAGKSTLFNRLTRAAVKAQDQLFATLDPTMRRVGLNAGRDIILSDTVGFISDLPTGLVAAFRATLEEVTEADLVLHVRDIAHPDNEAQCQDVEKVLAELGLDGSELRPVIEVLNKIDLLDRESRDRVISQAARQPDQVAISAVDGEGMDDLLSLIAERITAQRETLDLSIPHGDGAALAWLYEHGEVLSRRDDETSAHLQVRLDQGDFARFQRRYQAKEPSAV